VSFTSSLRRNLGLGLVACALWLSLPSSASAKEQVHTVYAGQRLASIAKRYQLTVDELCRANGLEQNSPIRPGQKLIIPERDANGAIIVPSGRSGAGPSAPAPPSKPTSKPGPKAAQRAVQPGEPHVHVVASGHTLRAVAQRYQVSVAAVCRASGITEKTPLKIGQALIVPAKSDPNGEYARQVRLTGAFDRVPESRAKGSASASYRKYQKTPWRRGYVALNAHGRQWKGYVVGPDGSVLPQAGVKINWSMGSRANGPSVDPRLIRLIAQVSDQFGGRPLHIVSGYRTKSFVAASKHKEGRALDFSVVGVPNEALRDYLRTLRNVGVGFYPNSSFVHLDVRSYNAFWIDYAGPGEAPRKHPQRGRSKVPSHDPRGTAHAPGSAGSNDEDEPPDDTAVDPTGGEEAPSEPAPEAPSEPAPEAPSEPAPEPPAAL